MNITKVVAHLLEVIKIGRPTNGYTFERNIHELLATIIKDYIETGLTIGRLNGRSGWWNNEVVTAPEFDAMMSDAMVERDLDKVILYTSYD